MSGYAGQETHKAKPDPLHDKRPKERMSVWFQVGDFQSTRNSGPAPARRATICMATARTA
jgi:hypothetical protein